MRLLCGRHRALGSVRQSKNMLLHCACGAVQTASAFTIPAPAPATSRTDRLGHGYRRPSRRVRRPGCLPQSADELATSLLEMGIGNEDPSFGYAAAASWNHINPRDLATAMAPFEDPRLAVMHGYHGRVIFPAGQADGDQDCRALEAVNCPSRTRFSWIISPVLMRLPVPPPHPLPSERHARSRRLSTFAGDGILSLIITDISGGGNRSPENGGYG